jgi:DNA-binding NtrC family response regulator
LVTCAGLIDAAAGGTLLLTAVEEMPASTQDRFIETFAQLQSIRDPSVAVRLMAGTTVSLRNRIAEGAFSESLFYRLNIIHVLKDVPTPSNAAREQRLAIVP